MRPNPKALFGRYRLLILIIALLLAVISILRVIQVWPQSAFAGEQYPTTGPAVNDPGGSTLEDDSPEDAPILLSEGQEQPQVVEPVRLATTTPLTEAQVQAILARLPAFELDPQDQVDFRLAQDPIPPPRPGETITESFPPPVGSGPPAQVETGPLEVLRFAPEGPIDIAPFVNITFNQPMVALATLEELAAQDVPVQLEPALPGTWRWLGTKTLTFEYDSELIDRLPKATAYRVTVPAGTRSATGGTLAEAVTWTFSTPPPKIVTSWPSGIPQPRNPLFFVAFDQRINPAAVLDTIEVRAGNRKVRLELAPDELAQANREIARLIKNTPEGRWLVFQAAELLPADTQVSVVVGPGTPSAEGPLVTQEAQSFSFYTYAPLKIIEHGCYWSNGPCQPLSPMYLRFNNPLDPAAFQESQISVQPELPGMVINMMGDTIQIQGATRGQTTYTVTVSGEVQDVFGQKLGRDARLTFKYGRAEPALYGPNKSFVTLDPTVEKPVFSVYAMNYNRLAVKVYAVQPSDWPAFKNYLRDYQRTDVGVAPPGRLVLDEAHPVEAATDTLTEVGIDLNAYLTGGFGHFIVIVEPPKELLKPEEYWRKVITWVQVTQIGLDAFLDQADMLTWATSLKDGAPLSDVMIRAGGSNAVGATGADGLARFPIPDGATFLTGTRGADVSLLPQSEYAWWDDGWRKRVLSDELRWFVFDDRQMYRPGEEIHLKGWLRRISAGPSGDVGPVGTAVTGIRYLITESMGNEIASGQVEVNALGGFDFAITLPQAVNLGYAQIQLDAQGSTFGFGNSQYWYGFQIQEFRRPEFEVNARAETPGPYFAGEHAVVAVEANYYAGGPLPNADTTWLVTSTPSQYSPPNWPDFIFGEWRPWWFYHWGGISPWDESGSQYQTFTGLTDASGTHYLRLDFPQGKSRPVSVTAEATVMDVNRQAWTGSTNLLVHPADLYVGLRSERIFVEPGTPLKIDVIVTDLDGKPVVDRPVLVTAARMEWKSRSGEWQEEAVDVQECRVGSLLEPVSCTFETPVGGTYRITAVVTDSQGRTNQSQFDRWVSGGQMRPARTVEQEQVTLIPDKESYQPGDVAKVLVQAPFSPAEGLLTVTRSGILETRQFDLQDGSATLEIEIEEQHIPNLNIQVDVTGSAPRRDAEGEIIPNVPPRPAFATGQLTLRIPPLQRTLAVEVMPASSELEPGAETSIDIVVRNASGQVVPGAEVTLVAVDEAVLALSGYRITDPVGVFYSERPSELMSHYSRTSIVLAEPRPEENLEKSARDGLAPQEDFAAAEMEAPMSPAQPMATATAGAGQDQSAPEPIRIRENFNPLAVFAPVVRTGADGEARVTVKLPDNLTRYRVTAVAVDEGRQFGLSESNLTARLPLMVRPSAPRFLNFGDRFELPVVLQNQTDQSMTVNVVVQAANLRLTGSAGVQVEVPARDRVEVRFPAEADKAGTARLMIAATAGDFVDAARAELPVYTPATSEAFATYGVVDAGSIAQPVLSPANVFPQYGGLEIQTSSTALQALTDAVLYLVSYPFDCTEQIASRILAISAMRDVLTAFKAEGMPSPAELEAAVSRDIETLRGLQNDDGGFPYWRRGEPSIPFNSIHTAHALQMAQRKGFTVPADMQSRLLEHLRQIENYYPAYYNQDTRRTLSAYALFVRLELGDRDAAKAQRILNEAGLEKLSLDAIGWLWPVLVDADTAGVQDDLAAIRRHVANRAIETAGAANFTTEYDDQNYLLLGSDRRTDAILLNALMVDSPQHDLIPKLVNGLLAHRTRGRWMNTQENVFVLLALDRYFNTFEAQEPDFVARIWLGEDYAGEHAYQGRTTDRHETVVPMSILVESSGTRSLILNKDGAGRLYYRLGLRYAPSDLQLDPLDMGFVVQRTYEAVDDPADVRQDEDGVWHIKAGARVRVRVKLVADNRRYHVALVDPLPAGLEIVNPELAVSGGIPADPTQPRYGYGWWWSWFEHQNLRDERAEAFTTLLWEGVYDYNYVARATTPGTFVVPPSRAEEMYSPEVFGRSASDFVVVE